MSEQSKIEWTGSTWNPVTGCTKVSPGCKNCYAERMAYRLQKMGQPNYRDGFEVTMHEHVLQKPYRWKKPQLIFVNSMSDLFHKKVTSSFVLNVLDVMKSTPIHTYQVLTKRSSRLKSMNRVIAWPENVWVGVSVENSNYKSRIDDLRACTANLKFISIEPLLGHVGQLDLSGIDWVIVGGESGPHARPIKKEWVRDIQTQCAKRKVPFFFKQWGGVNKKKAGRLLDGEIWDQMPNVKTLKCA